MQDASARKDDFVFTGFLACYWFGISLFGRKATTEKRITILMKETKIKTSSLSLTLKPGIKILGRLILFLIVRENENSKQLKMGGI